MRLLIAGCGYVGTALGRSTAAKGWQVWGLRRNPDLESFRRAGIEPLALDMLDQDSLKSLPEVDYAVFCQSPSEDSDSYQKTYVTATENLLKALAGQDIKKVLLISSTSVYGQKNGEWVDEKSETLPDLNGTILLAAEKTVLSSRLPGVVLRLAGIYGPERNRLQSIRSGRVKPELKDIYMNRVHVQDVVSAIELLLEKGKPGEIYIGADDEPSTQKEFYGWLYEKLAQPIPAESGARAVGVQGAHKRCSNKKLKSLGWEPKYSNYRQGYGEIISNT